MENNSENFSEHVARLRRLDACSVSDALDRIGSAGVIGGVPQRTGSTKVAGRVITVKLRTGEAPPGPPRHLGTAAIEAGGPDDVIVLEQRTGIEAACWGGLLTLGASLRGIAGVVADGPVRDVDEARALDFPIFSTAVTARTARGRIVEDGTNVPITPWGVPVTPGDYVLADGSAVVFVAAARIAEVLALAESIAAREAAMAESLRAGQSIGQVMGAAYEHMLSKR